MKFCKFDANMADGKWPTPKLAPADKKPSHPETSNNHSDTHSKQVYLVMHSEALSYGEHS